MNLLAITKGIYAPYSFSFPPLRPLDFSFPIPPFVHHFIYWISLKDSVQLSGYQWALIQWNQLRFCKFRRHTGDCASKVPAQILSHEWCGLSKPLCSFHKCSFIFFESDSWNKSPTTKPPLTPPPEVRRDLPFRNESACGPDTRWVKVAASASDCVLE